MFCLLSESVRSVQAHMLINKLPPLSAVNTSRFAAVKEHMSGINLFYAIQVEPWILFTLIYSG